MQAEAELLPSLFKGTGEADGNPDQSRGNSSCFQILFRHFTGSGTGGAAHEGVEVTQTHGQETETVLILGYFATFHPVSLSDRLIAGEEF